MGYDSRYSQWGKYVSVAKRKEKATKHVVASKKKGVTLNPVVIDGRVISKTFWGKAWCDNLESYSDYSNRLPRGRTYVRNGSVIDLQISKGQVKAQVMGSSLYNVSIDIKAMPESKWKTLIKACAGKIDSLIELLQGKFSKAVMEIITKKEDGLFPNPQEISMSCSCPDSAYLCKHIAAVLYGVGANLDSKPEWIFELRHVQNLDLVASASQGDMLIQAPEGTVGIDDSDLSTLFGIEMDSGKATTTTRKSTKTAKPTSKPQEKSQTKAKPKPKLKLKAKEEPVIKVKSHKKKSMVAKPAQQGKPIKKRQWANDDMVIITIVD